MDYIITFNGTSASESKQNLEAMKALNAKAKRPNVPLKDQLAPQELAYFQYLREKLLQSNGRELALSNYKRDADAYVEMVKVANAIRQGVEFKETDPRFFFVSAIMLLRMSSGINSSDLIDYDPKAACSIDSAIRFEGSPVVNSNIDNASKNMLAAKAKLDAFAAKYKLDLTQPGFETKISNAADRRAAIQAFSEFRAGGRILAYITDIKNIIHLNELSVRDYSELDTALKNMKDEADYKRIVDQIGAKDGTLPDGEKPFRVIVSAIGKRTASDKAMESSGVANTVKPYLQ